jgi:hypothetical protein
MDALLPLVIGVTAALGLVALGLGGVVLATPADGTQRRRGWPSRGSGTQATLSAGAR